MGKEHKLLFDFGLPWEYFSSALQIKKKKIKKTSKETTKQNKKNHYSKEEGIEHNSL